MAIGTNVAIRNLTIQSLGQIGHFGIQTNLVLIII